MFFSVIKFKHQMQVQWGQNCINYIQRRWVQPEALVIAVEPLGAEPLQEGVEGQVAYGGPLPVGSLDALAPAQSGGQQLGQTVSNRHGSVPGLAFPPFLHPLHPPDQREQG